LFVAFAGEEFGLRGSYEFAKKIKAKAVKAVINIEMIGRGLSEPNTFPFHTGPTTNSLVNIINKRLKKISKDSLGRVLYFIKDPFPDESLLTRSDNFPFELRFIPACTLMSTPPNDLYYHSVKDEIDAIDLKNMSILIKAIALGTEGLIRGTDTPK
jgi:Zn-dependent M28 family amino/carboxypeptidase